MFKWLKNNQIDWLKFIIIGIALGNLAISKAYIFDILKINNRLTGICLFGMILFGLVSAFNAFKLVLSTKEGILSCLFFVNLTLIISLILTYQMFSSIGKQPNIPSIKEIQSIYLLFLIDFAYLIVSVFLIIRRLGVRNVSKN